MKSAGLFRKPIPVVLVKNENPYTSVQGLNNIIVQNELKFYDKKGFWFGVGVGVGILTPIILTK